VTTLEERIRILSASSASILAQLNKLNRLKKQVKQAQATFKLRAHLLKTGIQKWCSPQNQIPTVEELSQSSERGLCQPGGGAGFGATIAAIDPLQRSVLSRSRNSLHLF
jgi:hypothetical protein